MAYFVVKRFGQMLMVMVASSMLLFVVTAFSATKVAENMLGPYASEQQYQVLRDKLQLSDPIFVRYFRWMGIVFGVIPDPVAQPGVDLGFEDPVRGPQY
ncbi:MAG: ABC transporter permease, partial [Pseudomonadota bacterium]